MACLEKQIRLNHNFREFYEPIFVVNVLFFCLAFFIVLSEHAIVVKNN